MLFISNFIVPFYQGIENQILGKFWSYGRLLHFTSLPARRPVLFGGTLPLRERQ